MKSEESSRKRDSWKAGERRSLGKVIAGAGGTTISTWRLLLPLLSSFNWCSCFGFDSWLVRRGPHVGSFGRVMWGGKGGRVVLVATDKERHRGYRHCMRDR